MYHYIYKVTDPNTGEFYIGRRSSNLEPELDIDYKGSMMSWSKEEDFNKDILIKEILIKNIETVKELCELESSMIELEIKNPLNKNAHIPSKGFYITGPLKDDHKKKISESWNTRVVSEETKKKMSESRKNSSVVKKMIESKEWRDKISESVKNSENFQKNVRSEERRNKISKSMKDSDKLKSSRSSKEFKEKCSEWQKGKPRTEEYKKKFNETRKINTKKKQDLEKNKLEETLKSFNFELSLVCESLSLSLKQLKRKLKKYKITLCPKETT